MPVQVMKYNPSFLTTEELVSQFVVRQEDLRTLLQTVQENTSGANQHVLVIGPRGSGKTMLVRRVAAEITRDPQLSERWYPLVFSEESYEVTTPGEFWLEAAFHLGQQTKDPRWHAKYEEYGAQWQDEDTMRERALGQLMAFADQQGKRLLLIVENLNTLLGEQMSDDDAWKLRHTLQNEPRVMLLATATSRFEEIDRANKAMYELFRVHHLQPLDRDQCRTLWLALTGQELEGDRVRPIQILTGGNLRLLTILSTFGAQLSLQQLMHDLVRLVDEHTEYFKSHLDSLPSTERKVYLALADRWDPSTAREVAVTARMEVSPTSSLLRRLVDRGAVVTLDAPGRTNWYQVAERMYNIYYLFRRRGAPAERVRAVVRFMISFYRPEELVATARRIAEEVVGLDCSQREDHYRVFIDLLYQVSEEQLHGELLQALRDCLSRLDGIPEPLTSMLRRERTAATQEDLDRICDDMTWMSHEMTRVHAWVTALTETRTHAEKSEFVEAEVACRKALEIEPDNVVTWFWLGQVLSKTSRFREAENAYRKAIELDPEVCWNPKSLQSRLDDCSSRLDRLERDDRALVQTAISSVYDLMHMANEMCRKIRANASAMLGALLCDQLSRFDEAEEACRHALAIDPKNRIAPPIILRLLLRQPQLLLRQPQRLEEAARFVGTVFAEYPDYHRLLLSMMAWMCAASKPAMFELALSLAQKAVALAPADRACLHTLASIQCAAGRHQDALKTAAKYLGDTDAVRKTVQNAVDLFVYLAACGQARGALQVVTNSPSYEQLEPLAVGFRLFLGEDVKVAAEIQEIGRDVAQRIAQGGRGGRAAMTALPPFPLLDAGGEIRDRNLPSDRADNQG